MGQIGHQQIFHPIGDFWCLLAALHVKNNFVLGLPEVLADDEFDAIEVERCRLENDLDELLPLLRSL